MKQKIKKKELISEVIALRLPASQLLYQHQFQYAAIFHHMFPASNCPLLTPLPLKLFINYPVTSCIQVQHSTEGISVPRPQHS